MSRIPLHEHRGPNDGGKIYAPAVAVNPASNDHAATTGDLTAHVAASDPHTGYRLESADHNHESTGAQGGTLDEDALALTDVTTNDASTTKHGFLKKLDNDTSHFMRGDGAWAAASGSGSVATDTIFDAKGDLPVGTGADTAAKLTVGANDTILMADSGQATGLKWVASQTPSTQAFADAAAEGTADTYARGDHKHGMPSPGVYADWTPVITADGGNPTMGTGATAVGRYTQIGKMVHAMGRITFGSASVAAGSGTYEINFPVAASTTVLSSYGTCLLYDASATLFQLAFPYALDSGEFRIAVASTTLVVQATHPWTWAANDVIIVELTYEAA